MFWMGSIIISKKKEFTIKIKYYYFTEFSLKHFLMNFSNKFKEVQKAEGIATKSTW